MEKTIFKDLKITDGTFLDNQIERIKCSKCNKPRKYFCYTCHIAIVHDGEQVPQIQLPTHIDVIKHPQEVDGKSTATHAAVLAPHHVTIYTYPEVPDYAAMGRKVCLVYPGEDSVTLQELSLQWNLHTTTTSNENSSYPAPKAVDDHSIASTSSTSTATDREPTDDNAVMTSTGCTSGKTECEPAYSDVGPPPVKRAKCDQEGEALQLGTSLQDAGCGLQRVVFIDSTWKQAKKIYLDERLRDLRQVKLPDGLETVFWRYQTGKPSSYLATIEAIYYFCKEYHEAFLTPRGVPYTGQYDDLLFYYKYLYHKIRHSAESGLSKLPKPYRDEGVKK